MARVEELALGVDTVAAGAAEAAMVAATAVEAAAPVVVVAGMEAHKAAAREEAAPEVAVATGAQQAMRGGRCLMAVEREARRPCCSM